MIINDYSWHRRILFIYTNKSSLPTTRVPTAIPTNWYKFSNTYINEEEYIGRSCQSNHVLCYKKYENDPNCAGVYTWNGPSSQSTYRCGSDQGNVECSLVAKQNIGNFYDRYGLMSNYQPDNRIVFINKETGRLF